MNPEALPGKQQQRREAAAEKGSSSREGKQQHRKESAAEKGSNSNREVKQQQRDRCLICFRHREVLEAAEQQWYRHCLLI
jgi:hypothetical protein